MNEILQYPTVGQLGNSILLGLKRRERNIENGKFIAEMQKHPNTPTPTPSPSDQKKTNQKNVAVHSEALGLRPLSEVRSG